MNTKILMTGFALALSTLSQAANNAWITDFETAKKQAAEEQKEILADFTGSDWCHWCHKLSDEVFSKDEFLKEASKKFILLELDYPKDKSKQSEALQQQNAALQKRFDIKGFPSVILFDSKGQPYMQTGYIEGGPKAYLKALDEMQGMRLKRDEALAQAEKLEGVEKAKKLFEALTTIPPNMHQFYPEMTSAIAKLDVDDTTGYRTVMAFQTMEKSYQASMQQGNVEAAMKLVNGFIEEKKPTGEALQRALVMKMDPLMGTEQFDKAEKVMDQIIAAAPETELAKFTIDFKPQLAKIKAQAEAAKKADTEKK